MTERDRAAPDLGDAITLATPRTDDPLQGIKPPLPSPTHPHQSRPSLIEKIHADKVSKLPLRNDQGSYDQHDPPDLSLTAAVGDYIQTRTAAWKEHRRRIDCGKPLMAMQTVLLTTGRSRQLDEKRKRLAQSKSALQEEQEEVGARSVQSCLAFMLDKVADAAWTSELGFLPSSFAGRHVALGRLAVLDRVANKNVSREPGLSL